MKQPTPPEDKVTPFKKDEAALALAAHFGPERWKRIIKQCAQRGMHAAHIQTLADRMIGTRQRWWPDNTALALAAAAIGFLCAIGSAPTAEDEAAYEAALKPL